MPKYSTKSLNATGEFLSGSLQEGSVSSSGPPIFYIYINTYNYTLIIFKAALQTIKI